MTRETETVLPITFLKPELSIGAYKIAVWNAPYDTGNLAHSIKRRITTPRIIQIHYSANDAHYIDIVEKRQNFIEGKTVPSIIELVIRYFETGKVRVFEFGSFRTMTRKFDKRQELSVLAKNKGFGKGKVLVGRSRYNGDVRYTRKMRSNRLTRNL